MSTEVTSTSTTGKHGKRAIFNEADEEQLAAWKRGEIELWRMDIMVDGEWVTRSMYTRRDVDREIFE
ncbi:hypothetical protein ACTDI4_11700 [Mesorhizobium sp. PUT5]|uniref:hypothetical protein n=1 Tax=Mesorhizobium sp. PUT5 TaxID=3454629 RepID=UPI003FA40FA8